jgi:hypothetical protein
MIFYSRGDRVSTLATTKGENTVLSTRKISVEEAEKNPSYIFFASYFSGAIKNEKYLCV